MAPSWWGSLGLKGGVVAAGAAVAVAAALLTAERARADACTVLLLSPADGTAVADSPQFRWSPGCASWRVWFSPVDTFNVDLERTPWRSQRRYQFSEGDWTSREDGAWADGVYWKVQGRSADGTLSFSETRFVDVLPKTRFVAVGDTGNGNATQYAVADAMATVCGDQGCDFVLLLGDNIYPEGVTSPDPAVDPQWDDKFEIPYADLSIPFYPVLGNHDYGDDPGGGGGGWPPTIDLARGDAQVDHTAYSSKWSMPNEYYSFTHGDVEFFALDTTRPLAGPGPVAQEESVMGPAISGSVAPWRIAFGHYPYLSNGSHGDAGNYDGVAGRGSEVQGFLDDNVCGQVDLYVSGHDHGLQWLSDTCAGTELIVSGGGSDSRPHGAAHPVEFQVAAAGFFWFEVQGDTMTVEVYDEYGILAHQDVRTN